MDNARTRGTGSLSVRLVVALALAVGLLVLRGKDALAQAGHEGHDAAAAKTSPALMTGLSEHTHPIATANPEAQRYFDMGLNLAFGFNHEEALRAFRKAAELDPKAAMPLWGVAYVLGPNINMPRDAGHDRDAVEAIARAQRLAAAGPEPERAYVEAMARRYSTAPKADLRALDEAFRTAMRDLAARYPDDLDAQTIYAESIMDLNPWKFWSLDGRPAADTPEIVAVLESVLKRDPGHIGANHFYIHAVEASPTPEKALVSARRLESAAPAAGHLVHMPGHIYLRTGDFADTVRTNEQAAASDEAFFKVFGKSGMYPIMYYTHNLHFVGYAAMMSGDAARALSAAAGVAENTRAYMPPGALMAGMEPFLEMYSVLPLAARWRFGRWDDVLALPMPDARLPIDTALWHAARGCARIAKQDRAAATEEQKAFRAAREKVPAGAFFAFSPAQDLLSVAGHILDARLLEAMSDHEGALAHWSAAVQAQDNLPYNEPPDWFYPVRESHGGALLRSGRAAEAERVFRADLEKNPRNGRSLFGLSKALEAQKRSADAALVKRQFEAAWKNATVTLKVDDL